MSITIEDRIEHERAFHDERYRHDPRAAQDKFYNGLQESDARFHELVAGFEPGQRVLELGCGIESLAFDLARRGVEVVGIDISPVAVEKATEAAAAQGLTNVSFQVMNAEVLEFTADSFDGVIGTAVLHHLDVAQAYSEMARVLRPEGRVVFIEPLGHNPVINAYRRRTPESRTDFEHPLRCEDFGLAQRFFGDVDVETFHLLAILTSPVADRWWGRPIHRVLAALDRALLGLTERMRWQAWIAVAELRSPR
ncbi:MAG: methyltransferase domain-containing protein [Actinomycetota bacterium]